MITLSSVLMVLKSFCKGYAAAKANATFAVVNRLRTEEGPFDGILPKSNTDGFGVIRDHEIADDHGDLPHGRAVSQPCFGRKPAPHNTHLQDGETLVSAAGFPALVKFVAADKDKPLVIFVPGDAYLARIAYGFPDGNEQDFLAYWINQAGFSVLGVSLPS